MDDPALLDIFDTAAQRVQQGESVEQSVADLPSETAEAVRPALEMAAQVAALPRYALSTQSKDALATRLMTQMAEKKKAMPVIVPVIESEPDVQGGGIEHGSDATLDEDGPPSAPTLPFTPRRPSLHRVAFRGTRGAAAVLAAIILTVVVAGIAVATYATLRAITAPQPEPKATPTASTSLPSGGSPTAQATKAGTGNFATSTPAPSGVSPQAFTAQPGDMQPAPETALAPVTGTQTPVAAPATHAASPVTQPSLTPVDTLRTDAGTPVPQPTQTQPRPTLQPTATLPPPGAQPTATFTPVPTLPVPTATVPALPTLPSPTLPPVPTLPLPTITLPVPTIPLPTITLPVPTLPLPTMTIPVPTIPLPTVTLPVPTIPLPTVTVPVPTVTLPVPTITVPPLPTLPLSPGKPDQAAPGRKYTRFA